MVDIVEDDEVAYRISYPYTDPDDGTAPNRNVTGYRRSHEYAVRTRFASAGYAGTMTHLWRTRAPTPADVSRALILVRHGVDTVQQERDEGHRGGGHDTVRQHGAVADIPGAVDPAVAALLQDRARRLRHWARCERQRIALGG